MSKAIAKGTTGAAAAAGGVEEEDRERRGPGRARTKALRLLEEEKEDRVALVPAAEAAAVDMGRSSMVGVGVQVQQRWGVGPVRVGWGSGVVRIEKSKPTPLDLGSARAFTI